MADPSPGPSGRSGPERVAHRGMPREVPENTLAGFLLALEHGADAVELDVHRTCDGVVVVHHDPTLAGQAIAELTARDVASLAPAGAPIPTLRDILDAIGERATVYVEIKGAEIEADVIAVLRQHPRVRAAIHSFDHAAIERASRLAPDIPRGILLDRGTRDAPRALRDAVRRTSARDGWPHFTLVDAALMAEARALGARVIPWTVNDPALAQKLVAAGVDGICTDDVRVLSLRR